MQAEPQVAIRRAARKRQFPPIDEVTKPNLTTEELSFFSNLAPSTWRTYACQNRGPIRPLRIGNKLNWPTAAVRVLVGCQAATAPAGGTDGHQ